MAEAPNTFSFTPPGATQATAPANEALMQGGPQQEPLRNEVVKVAPVQDHTFDLLSQFSTAVAKGVAKKNDEAFVTGMYKVLAGESLESVMKESPWYANIWGRSADIRGAMAATAWTKVAAVNSYVTDNMHELASIPPEEFPKHLMELTNKYLTGDPETDMMIRQGAIQNMTIGANLHAKERVKQVQIDMLRTHTGLIVHNAGNLQSVFGYHDPSMVTPDMRNIVSSAFVDSLAPKQGQTPEAHRKTVIYGLSEAADKGYLHAVNAALDMGILETLPVEDREPLRAKIRADSIRHAKDTRDSMAEQIGHYNLQAHDGKMPLPLAITIAKGWNTAYEQRSGNREPLFHADVPIQAGMTSAQYVKAMAQRDADRALANQRRNEARDEANQTRMDAQAKADAKAYAESDEVVIKSLMLSYGDANTYGNMKRNHIAKPNQIDKAMYGTYKLLVLEDPEKPGIKYQDKEASADFIAKNKRDAGATEAMNPFIQADFNTLQNQITNVWNPSAAEAYDWVERLENRAGNLTEPGRMSAASLFDKPGVMPTMKAFQAEMELVYQVEGRGPKEKKKALLTHGPAAWEKAWTQQERGSISLDKDAKVGFADAIDEVSRDEGWFWKVPRREELASYNPIYLLNFGTTVPEDSHRLIMDMSIKEFKIQSNYKPDKEAWKIAIQKSAVKGLEVSGSVAWVNPKGTKRLIEHWGKNSVSTGPVTQAVIDEGWVHLLRQKLDKLYVKRVDSYRLLRHDDAKGVPQWELRAKWDGIEHSGGIITGDMLYKSMEYMAGAVARQKLRQMELQEQGIGVNPMVLGM